MWKVFVFGQGSRPYFTLPHQCNCITVSSAKRGHNKTHSTTVRLHYTIGRSTVNIQCHRYEAYSAHWYKLTQWTKGKKQSQWKFVFVKWNSGPRKQRGSAQHSTNHQTCHVISNRNIIGSTLHHGKWSSVYQDQTGGNGAQTTTKNHHKQIIQW